MGDSDYEGESNFERAHNYENSEKIAGRAIYAPHETANTPIRRIRAQRQSEQEQTQTLITITPRTPNTHRHQITSAHPSHLLAL